MFDDRRCFGEEISRWRYGYPKLKKMQSDYRTLNKSKALPVVVQFTGIVWIQFASRKAIFTGINAMPQSRSFRFGRTSTQWSVIHFAGFVVPQIAMESMRMLDLFGQFLHGTIFFLHIEFIVWRIGWWTFLRWKLMLRLTFIRFYFTCFNLHLCRHTLCFRFRGGVLYGGCFSRIFGPRATSSWSNSVHSVSKRLVDSTSPLSLRL